ncbi:EF-hand calcium-binding domain-containing protein 9 [Podochytrium sp. JEL0797]|nr:EF-hand calcium-binding domain-containing protein 9 [Podochytrium sp. JEL0797]
MYQHWRTCFSILDEDGGGTISIAEFCTLGFLFNFTPQAIQNIYKEFDVAGTQELDYSEFRLFVLAAIEMQKRLDTEIEPLPHRMLKFVRNYLKSIKMPFGLGDSKQEEDVMTSMDLVNFSPSRRRGTKNIHDEQGGMMMSSLLVGADEEDVEEYLSRRQNSAINDRA